MKVQNTNKNPWMHYLLEIPFSENGTSISFQDFFTKLWESQINLPICFEILCCNQTAQMVVSFPRSIHSLVSGGLYAVCPHLNLKEIQDPLEDSKSENYVIHEYVPMLPTLIPFHNWSEKDTDPLGGFLSVMVKNNGSEASFLQICVSPQLKSFSRGTIQAAAVKSYNTRLRMKAGFVGQSELRQRAVSGAVEKRLDRLFNIGLTIGVISENNSKVDPVGRIQQIEQAIGAYGDRHENSFRAYARTRGIRAKTAVTNRTIPARISMSPKELDALYHIPSEEDAPYLHHLLTVRQPPPASLPIVDINNYPLAISNYRDQSVPFVLPRGDRRRHLYIVGKSGSGKSKFIEQLAHDDLRQGCGFGVLDPHGDLVDSILQIIPKSRMKDVVILDPSDVDFPALFNPLETVPETQRTRVALGFIEIFKKLFGINWSPRIEHVLRYTTLALLEVPGTSVLSILDMLSDKKYRQQIVAQVSDEVVRRFWSAEFASWSERYDAEAITPLVNKVGQFVSTTAIRRIVGQPENRFDFRKIMDEGKILLVKVPRGMLGEENAALLGAMVVTKLYQAAMSRADMPEQRRRDFYLYVDEFQYFATDTFAEILSEARKYRLNLTIAHQFMGQLDQRMRATVMGNVGTMVSFRVGAQDAAIVAQEFSPRFSPRDAMNLSVQDFIIKMSIKGETNEAFSATTANVIQPKESYAAECINWSRKHYAGRVVPDTLSQPQYVGESLGTVNSIESGGQRKFPMPAI